MYGNAQPRLEVQPYNNEAIVFVANKSKESAPSAQNWNLKTTK